MVAIRPTAGLASRRATGPLGWSLYPHARGGHLCSGRRHARRGRRHRVPPRLEGALVLRACRTAAQGVCTGTGGGRRLVMHGQATSTYTWTEAWGTSCAPTPRTMGKRVVLGRTWPDAPPTSLGDWPGAGDEGGLSSDTTGSTGPLVSDDAPTPQPREAIRSRQAASHRRQDSAQTRQCSCISACWAHSSPQALHAAAHASRTDRVRFAS
jgi:hypothetical protein